MPVAAPIDVPVQIREALIKAAASTSPRRFLAALNASGFINTHDATVLSLRQAALDRLGIPSELLDDFGSQVPVPHGLADFDGEVFERNMDALDPAIRARVARLPHGVRYLHADDGGRIIATANGRWYALAVDPADIERSISKFCSGKHTTPGPFLIAGFSNPQVLKSLVAATAASDSLYRPRIDVIEPNSSTAAIGFGCEDISSLIADSRVHWHIGSEAAERRMRELESTIDEALPVAVLPSEGIPTATDVTLQERLDGLHARQREELIRLRAKIDAVYASRDRAWWRNRFTETSRLRVLVISCRHTTFIRHAASDLADAMRDSGAVVRIVEEAGAESKLTALHYARAIVEHEPDVVITMNFPRSTFRAAVPANVPYVCWIQDAMSHLFDSEQGRSQTDFDFNVGYLFPELFERFGYPSTRTLNCTVVASDTKFSIPSDPRISRSCELAMVSHHGESPKRLHESLRSRFDTIPGARGFLDELFPKVVMAATDASRRCVNDALLDAIRGAASATLHRELDESNLIGVLRQYAHPIADRVFRHETIHWAADLADARGWRLKLYGKGWETCERFACYAAGEIEHGEALRDVYHGAALHLHASITALAHQRVMECALSGGLCLPRLHREMLRGTLREMQLELLEHAPDEVDEMTGSLIYHASARPELARFITMWRALGEGSESNRLVIPHESAVELNRGRPWLRRNGDPNMIFGDLAANTFRDRESFESVAIRAVEDPAWRQQQADAIRERVAAGYTHRVFANRVIELVSSDFR